MGCEWEDENDNENDLPASLLRNSRGRKGERSESTWRWGIESGHLIGGLFYTPLGSTLDRFKATAFLCVFREKGEEEFRIHELT
jgi:hypothetical protein